ncbi:hypothetical protein [Actinoplanes couchii]|uniref:DUF3040 domain-containing protein n=1 Tax=Actinoplanes couchii TaxID=403638 RepID=A0ABQ3X0X0_9ACTN|nr:hypothetical protein [Actinoplanes couchii]MDR6316554.1 hypothetical protein [Actinoplanes couchii]GID52168.1 hypothetical protein Aco03nite_005720 [Actinoplanes couchii]
MSDPGQPEQPERSELEVRNRLVDRRKERIRQQIAKNRAGDYTVPTWVLTLLLVALIGGWALLIFTA